MTAMPPAYVAPPANSWIVVERPEPDRIVLRWHPNPQRRLEWDRWRTLLVVCGMCAGWFVILTALGGLWYAMASQLLGGPGPQSTDSVLGAAFLGVFLDLLILGWVGLLITAWRLTRPSRPESLTLTAAGLIYDPGNFTHPGVPPQCGERWETGRSQVGDVRLDRVDGRQRLTIDRGVERIEIGACLREPEREWLVGLLWAWAAPAPRPAATEEPHVHHVR